MTPTGTASSVPAEATLAITRSNWPPHPHTTSHVRDNLQLIRTPAGPHTSGAMAAPPPRRIHPPCHRQAPTSQTRPRRPDPATPQLQHRRSSHQRPASSRPASEGATKTPEGGWGATPPRLAGKSTGPQPRSPMAPSPRPPRAGDATLENPGTEAAVAPHRRGPSLPPPVNLPAADKGESPAAAVRRVDLVRQPHPATARGGRR